MRIGFSTSVIQRGKTGVAQYVFGLLRALLPAAAEHTFFLFVLAEDLPLFDFVKGRMLIETVSERYRPPVRNIFWHQTALPRRARELGLDALHVPSYRRLLWPRPCPLVATIHDLAPFRLAGKYDWKRTLYGRIVVRRLAQRQDRVIAISHNTAADIVRYFRLPPGVVRVIYNGLDHDRFHPADRHAAKGQTAARYGLNRGFFLYVSRLEHPAKNHVRLIRAYEQFRNLTGSHQQLVFSGSDWHGADVVHDAIRKSPFREDILSLGFVPDDCLPDLYRAAEVFVYPSLHEGFGLPPVEAMACGCPVIASDCGSLGEVVGDAAALVDPLSVDSIAGQLCRLTSDLATREAFRRDGLRRARDFDWASTSAETMAVYRQVAETSQKGYPNACDSILRS